MAKNDGCGFGKTTRQMLLDTREDLKEIKSMIKRIDDKTTEMFNHMTDRMQKLENTKLSWAVTIIITLLSSLSVALIVYSLKIGG